MNIHNTAIIDKKAQISEDVEIGPYCVIGENVKLSKGVKLHSHVCIKGMTLIGESTEIYPFASIGYPPQDLKYNGENSILKIGKNNVVREYKVLEKALQSDLDEISATLATTISKKIKHPNELGLVNKQ